MAFNLPGSTDTHFFSDTEHKNCLKEKIQRIINGIGPKKTAPRTNERKRSITNRKNLSKNPEFFRNIGEIRFAKKNHIAPRKHQFLTGGMNLSKYAITHSPQAYKSSGIMHNNKDVVHTGNFTGL